MTKAKKVLSLVLAVVMVAAMFAFSASAVASQKATLKVTPSATTAQIGDVITVTVELTTDYYAAATAVPVYYNPAVFEFVAGSVVDVAKMFGASATDMQSYNDAATGCLKVAFIPQSANGATAKTLSGPLFTFQLKAIANGDSPVEVKAADQKTSKNAGGTLYCGAYATSSVTSEVDMYDQTFAITNTTVTVGAAAAPEIVAKAGTTGYVDATNKYVYGVTAGDVAANYFEATNGGSLEWAAGISPSGDPTSVDGTGAKVTLKDAAGTPVATYTLIIFGDVNGDGNISAADYSAVKNITRGVDYAVEFRMAADVAKPVDITAPAITASDYSAVKDATRGFDITINPYN